MTDRDALGDLAWWGLGAVTGAMIGFGAASAAARATIEDLRLSMCIAVLANPNNAVPEECER